MNPRLRALLVVVGLAVSGGVAYQLAVPAPEVTPGQLADAGIAECSPVTVRATVRTGHAALADAGEVTDAGDSSPRYRAFYVPARLCPEPPVPTPLEDGGVGLSDGGHTIVLTGLPNGMEAFRVEVLSDAGTIAGLRPDLGHCACRRRAAPGTCRMRLQDGGLVVPPPDTELQPGQWQGNCARKSCGVIAGDQGFDMPGECR